MSKFSSFLEVFEGGLGRSNVEVFIISQSFGHFSKFLNRQMSLNSKFWSFLEYIAKRQSFDDFSKF